ncbi:MAG: prephenate dehydrogenase [Anaerolineae bacterium]|nr:prephenate dehydrogenase [Anaerolineae bacterium]
MASQPRITIIGAGFVGTSLGLGLVKARSQGGSYEIIGHDRDANISGAAKKRGAVDRVEWNLPASVEGADMVFLATPIDEMEAIFEIIAPVLKPGVILTDTGGTKAEVMQWAAARLPATVNFIGGDPLLGRDGWRADEASADAFQDTLYCLTPAINADADAIRILADFVSSLGAQPYFLDPLEHDGIAGGVTHLPFLMSWALVRALANSPSWPEAQKSAGVNTMMLASLVGASPSYWAGPALTNATALGHWIDAAVRELQALQGALAAGDPDEIRGGLDKAGADYLKLVARGREEHNPLQDVGRDRMRQMFLGSLGAKRRDKGN